MRAMTLRLPDEVHEALRREAFDSRRSMNHVILEAIYALDFVRGDGPDGLRGALIEAFEMGSREGSK